jgi:hypothetical protein
MRGGGWVLPLNAGKRNSSRQLAKSEKCHFRTHAAQQTALRLSRRGGGRTFVARPFSLAYRYRDSRSIGPAPPALRAEVVSSRAHASSCHWMASTSGASPPSRAASFRNRDDRAVGMAERRGGDPGAGGGRKTKSQGGRQKDRLHHVRVSLYSSQLWHGVTLPFNARKAIGPNSFGAGPLRHQDRQPAPEADLEGRSASTCHGGVVAAAP